MTRIPIALQLYSVRTECATNLENTLRAVAAMGYEGVEFAGFYNSQAAEVRNMLDQTGLKIAGAHVALDTLLGESFAATVQYHEVLGNTSLIVPGLPPERRESRSALIETARIMNELAESLAPRGMVIGYHCHYYDFRLPDGETQYPWDTLISNTIPAVVMQFDTGNALHEGADAASFLERYPGRAVTVHLKEHSASNPHALIGEGEVPWPQIFKLCEGIGGTRWYIVEQEQHLVSPLDSARGCLENLKAMGK